MVAITLRADLSRGLTNAEIDANFSNLKTAVEAAALSAEWASLTGKPTTLSGYGITDAQASLVSGTNIKTINGTSILGSGDLEIAGGVVSFNTRGGAVTLSSTDVVNALGFTPYNSTNPSSYITASALESYLPLAGGTLSGGLTVTGNVLMAANSGASRTMGFAGGTNTTLVLQAGAASGSGANLELTFDKYAYLDADTTKLRSNDAATTFLQVSASATNVVTGALQQGGNQVLHAGNYNSYALPLSGGTLTGNLFGTNASFSGQGRFAGWYTTGMSTGFAIELGTSGGDAYILGYNRTTSTYGNVEIDGTNIRLLPQGGALTGPGGNVILHAGNYTSYPAAKFDSSVRCYSREWIEMPNYSGLYSGNNGAHFYPNNATYGSWKIDGTRNSWGGIEFGTGVRLMMNADAHGFHNTTRGWGFYNEAGSGYFPGNVTAYWSDERLKENLRLMGRESLAILGQFNAFRYNWNAKVAEFNLPIAVGKEEIGLIAQHVQRALPDAVVVNKAANTLKSDGTLSAEDYLTINYDRITPLLVDASNIHEMDITELRAGLAETKLELLNIKSTLDSMIERSKQ